MANKSKKDNSTVIYSDKKPTCPKCDEKSTLGYLNGRNGKVNYFCSKCSIEVTFSNSGNAISFAELSADGTYRETLIKGTKKNKRA